MSTPIGIIGGSGLYAMEEFEKTEELTIETPFGPPSDALVGGFLRGRQVWFLPRHGRGHTLLPHEINHRANIWAMRSLGVRFMFCVTAVGSLQLKYEPRHVVVHDQYFDRSSRRERQTFFGSGICAHIAFGDPVSEEMRRILLECAGEVGIIAHNGGTYVSMEGPAFSTRAESESYRRQGFDIIGMTNLAEAKLAREAEIALATLGMVTDYDCWHEENVTAQAVFEHVKANAANAQQILAKAVERVPDIPGWPEHRALKEALFTSRVLWPEETVNKLKPILEPYL